MKCMIIEDELPAIKILKSYLDHFGDLELVGIFHNTMDAMSELQRRPIDILFLDIQLPKISGIRFLHAMHHRPMVILTTAHREFALEGYDLEITDYLLKPISFERFTKAIMKTYNQRQLPMASIIPYEDFQNTPPFIYVRCEREFVKINLAELCYIEGIKNHVKLVTTNGNYLTLSTISHIGEKLPKGLFLRIHKSYIVSLTAITKFGSQYACVGSKVIPIGRHYKHIFDQWVEGNRL